MSHILILYFIDNWMLRINDTNSMESLSVYLIDFGKARVFHSADLNMNVLGRNPSTSVGIADCNDCSIDIADFHEKELCRQSYRAYNGSVSDVLINYQNVSLPKILLLPDKLQQSKCVVKVNYY